MQIFVNDKPLEFADDSIAYFRANGGVKGAYLRARIPAAAPEGRDVLLMLRKGEPDLLIRDDDTIEIHEGAQFYIVPNGIMGG